MRRRVSHFLALVVVASLAVTLFAGVADAKSSKMSAKQKAAVRAKLRKQIKKNPKAIMRKSFVKKAALVNFKLPVTLGFLQIDDGRVQGRTIELLNATSTLQNIPRPH